MRWPSAFVAIALLLCLVPAAAAMPVPEGGIGITSAPDSVAGGGSHERGCPDYAWASWPSKQGAEFESYPIQTYDTWIDTDVDLLIDHNFTEHDSLLAPVGQSEAIGFLQVLDGDDGANRFGWPYTDLGMVYKAFGESDTAHPYDPEGQKHFFLFPICYPDTTLRRQIDHADIYLVPARLDTSEGHDPDWTSRAEYPSPYRVYNEDAPYDSTAATEWKWNSFSVTDNFGKRDGSSNTDWYEDAAGGAVHEFTHACWQSNTNTVGLHWYWDVGEQVECLEGTDYNELFACAATHLAEPPEEEGFGSDLRYAYSILRDESPCTDPLTEGVNNEHQRYRLWAMFAAYLGYQFDAGDDDDIEDSLLSRWARNVTTWGEGDDNVGLERNFCGLATIMDGDTEFEFLGYAPPNEYLNADNINVDGWYRLNKMFSNYGIARWVNYQFFPLNEPQPYYFDPDYSPYTSVGQFQKVDKDSVWSFNALWELAIPPEFVLDSSNVGQWEMHPDPDYPACPDGWLDVEHYHAPSTGIYHDCVPIQADLWGSNYLVFRADTLAFGTGVQDTLVVQFNWLDDVTNLMHPRVELWLSVLTYSASVEQLFLKGNRLEDVETVRFRRPATGATVRVEDFKRDASEAVVIVLTVVPWDHDGRFTGITGIGAECLDRTSYSSNPCPDLHYSYRFRVGVYTPPPPPPQGCPFLSSLGREGYARDNNVLYAAYPGGDDVMDAYLLSRKPEALGGAYHLRFTETEDERTRFDSVELLAVDHAADAHIAVLQDGTIGTYRVTEKPVACRDQDGNDVLNLVPASDGETCTIEAGGWLDVVFPSEPMTRGGGGIEEEGNPDEKYEELPPPGGGGRGEAGDGALSLAPLCYRANRCVNVLDMPDAVVSDGEFITLRVTAPTDYHLDRLSMVERSEDPVVVTGCALSSAQHSEFASCAGALATQDGTYSTLAQGDTIDLVFKAPGMKGERRDFVFLSRGGEVDRGGGEVAEQPEAAVAAISPTIVPNPFNPATTISFSVPPRGGRVAVSIYNMAGKLIRRLADAEMPSGQHTVTWDGRGERSEAVGSGVYFCRIEVPGQSDQKKLVLLK